MYDHNLTPLLFSNVNYSRYECIFLFVCSTENNAHSFHVGYCPDCPKCNLEFESDHNGTHHSQTSDDIYSEDYSQDVAQDSSEDYYDGDTEQQRTTVTGTVSKRKRSSRLRRTRQQIRKGYMFLNL